jgi:hypothetical protein
VCTVVEPTYRPTLWKVDSAKLQLKQPTTRSKKVPSDAKPTCYFGHLRLWFIFRSILNNSFHSTRDVLKTSRSNVTISWRPNSPVFPVFLEASFAVFGIKWQRPFDAICIRDQDTFCEKRPISRQICVKMRRVLRFG